MASHMHDTKLPSKENSLFRRTMKCYEQKQYKNGLKFAKQILAVPQFADHGETLSMKGLLLNCLGKREEGLECVKKGLKNDVKSFVCWHVYGMFQIYDKKYEEAIKCYRNALKIDESQVQILKDLSKIQVHIRDIDGFKESRYKLLKLRPTQHTSWIHLALAENLALNYDQCLKILSEFINTQNITQAQYENGELLKYQNFVMCQAGHFEEALNHLCQKEALIFDKLYVDETKADLYCKLNDPDKAILVYWKLVKRNPENVSYYKGLERAMKIQLKKDKLAQEERLHIYQKALEINPRALLPQKLPLQFSTGPKFRELMDQFLRKHLVKGTPSLFTLIKNLYTTPEKVQIIGDLIDGYLTNLETLNKFDATTLETQWPTTILWTLLLKSRHLNAIGLYAQALKCIDKAIDHTPSFIDAYVVKAKIYKNCGNIVEACALMNECQSLDTADRYLNCLCAKYYLRAGLQHKADDMLAKFTKANSSPSEDLNEMQCMWYLISVASANYRIGDYGIALQKCAQIYKHFQDMIEDTFDFHTYCPRKSTLVAYIQTLTKAVYHLNPSPYAIHQNHNNNNNNDDEIMIQSQNKRSFSRCARIAIEICLKMHDNPAIAKSYDPKYLEVIRKNYENRMGTFIEREQNVEKENLEESQPETKANSTAKVEIEKSLTKMQINNNFATEKLPNAENLTASELKKLKNKEKRALHKQNINNINDKNANSTENSSNFHKGESLDPCQLMKVPDPLKEADKFLLPLLINHWFDFQTHYLAFQMAFRKGKHLLVIRHLVNMHTLLNNIKCQINNNNSNNLQYLKKLLTFYECWVLTKIFLASSNLDTNSPVDGICSSAFYQQELQLLDNFVQKSIFHSGYYNEEFTELRDSSPNTIIEKLLAQSEHLFRIHAQNLHLNIPTSLQNGDFHDIPNDGEDAIFDSKILSDFDQMNIEGCIIVKDQNSSKKFNSSQKKLELNGLQAHHVDKYDTINVMKDNAFYIREFIWIYRTSRIILSLFLTTLNGHIRNQGDTLNNSKTHTDATKPNSISQKYAIKYTKCQNALQLALSRLSFYQSGLFDMSHASKDNKLFLEECFEALNFLLHSHNANMPCLLTENKNFMGSRLHLTNVHQSDEKTLFDTTPSLVSAFDWLFQPDIDQISHNNNNNNNNLSDGSDRTNKTFSDFVREYVTHLKVSLYPLIDFDLIAPYVEQL